MRKSEIIRETKETKILCNINLDGNGSNKIKTGIGFMDHMLELFSHHSLIDLELFTKGDVHVDLHHSIEDTGLVLAMAISKALSNKKGIKRYGHSYVPMDECLTRCVIDFSGRPELVWRVNLGLEKIGNIDTELFFEFFKSYANESKSNIHIENFYGKNTHHIIESCFKSFAKSTRQAIEIDKRIINIVPSSKGSL
tara:strand:- start:795 stop:1382 length:588 start_codon:yes stop_codon:yes gene_type:complete